MTAADVLHRLTRPPRAVAREARAGWRLFARGRLRFLVDVLLYRVLFVVRVRGSGRVRRVTTRSGLTIAYRLNRGDLASIREVWLEEAYLLPSGTPTTVADLGANIGLTSLWLWQRYGVQRVVAVEPDPGNAALARENLRVNAVPGEVVEAAVGPEPGRVGFATGRESNTGRVGSGELVVDVVTMDGVLERLGGTADLVKLDIEGGEADLLDRKTEWLRRVGSIIAEIHPKRVDYGLVIERLRSAGFEYVPCNSAWEGSMDFFVRRDTQPSSSARTPSATTSSDVSAS